MSDRDRFEERLRALGAPADGADWEDVLQRAGEPLSARRFARRQLVAALAAVVMVAATVGGILVVTRGTTRPSPSTFGGLPGGKIFPPLPGGHKGVTCDVCGPTSPEGATGREGPTGNPGPTGPDGPTGDVAPTRIKGYTRPASLSPSQLAAESRALGASIYWAGPRAGYELEYSHGWTTSFVIYKPDASHLPGDFMVVSTYPVPDALTVLKKQAGSSAIDGPAGSVIVVGGDPKSVYLAFPHVDYEIEISSWSPVVALATAKSGDIQPAG